MYWSSSIFAALLLVVAAKAQEDYTLLHRFLSVPPTGPPPPFQPYGVVTIHSRGDQFPAVEFKHSTDGVEEMSTDDGKGWYQLAIETDDEDWPMTSMKSCHLSTSPLEISIIPLSTHLSIQLNPPKTPCPLKQNQSLALPKTNPIISIKTPIKPQSPTLAPPPIVDSKTGLPTVPPPEKSFLQKYWLPIIGLAIFAMSQMGPDEPRANAPK